MRREGILLYLLAFVIGLSVFPGETARAQNVDEGERAYHSLDDIIVSATRVASRILEIPASASVMTGEEINSSNYSTLFEAFRSQKSVFYDDVNEAIQVRGQSTDDVQVIIDGMPSFNPFNNDSNMESIPLLNIDRVEILRGSSSSLFGGNAVAGVINITTVDPDYSYFKVKFGGGSESAFNKAVEFHVKGEKLGVGVGWETRRSNGYAQRYARVASSSASANATLAYGPIKILPNENGGVQYIVGERGDRGYSRDYGWIKLKYDFTDSVSVKYAMNYFIYEGQTTNARSYLRDANGNPLFAGSYQLPDGRFVNFAQSAFTDYVNRKETMTHSLQLKDEERQISLNLGYSQVKDAGYNSGNDLAGITAGTKAFYPGKTYNLDLQKVWRPLGAHNFLAGINLRQDNMTYRNLGLTRWKDSSSVYRENYNSGGKDQLGALFAQDEMKFGENFRVIAGLRFDYYKNMDGYSNYLNPRAALIYPSHAYQELSPKLAVEYMPDAETSFYASYGHAFRPPDLYQLFRISTYSVSGAYHYVGNPFLKPEKSDTFELGFKKIFFGVNLEMALFQTITKGAIIAVRYPPGTFPISADPTQEVAAYTNVNKEQRRGVEISLERVFGEYFSGYANYAFQRGRYKGGSNSTVGRIITNIPDHIFHAGATFAYKDFDFTLSGTYLSKRGDRDVPKGIYYASTDPYFQADISSNLTLFEKYKITLSVNNVFDDDHLTSGYFNPGRTFLLSLTGTFS